METKKNWTPPIISDLNSKDSESGAVPGLESLSALASQS